MKSLQMTRRTLAGVLAAAVFGASRLVLAQSTITGDTDAPPPPQQPDELLREGIRRLSQFVDAYQDPTSQQMRNFLVTEIAPYFDFDYMAKWAAGPYHRRFNDSQRERFTQLLADTFLSALARNLGTYARPFPTTVVSHAQPGRTSTETVVVADVGAQSFPIQLLFRFYWSPRGWKIFDVAANGVSAVGYYRRYYVDLLRRHGPEMVLQ